MIREGRRPGMVGTMLRIAVSQRGTTSEHHLVLAVVAAPNVVKLPASMPPVRSSSEIIGQAAMRHQLTTKGSGGRQLPDLAGDAAKLGRTRRRRQDPASSSRSVTRARR
jgi:hypothetical protein